MKTSEFVEDRSEELLTFHRRIFDNNVVRMRAPHSGDPPPSCVNKLKLNQSTKQRLRSLLAGTSRSYKSDSEADFAACSLLIEGGMTEEPEMDAVIRGSALMRPKWDESRGDSTYGQRTIRAALDAAAKVEREREEGVASAVAQINEDFAVVKAGSSVVILQEVIDAEGKPGIDLLSEDGFCRLLRKYPKINGTNIAALWLNSLDRREYHGLVFDPSNNAPDSFYNLFHGFSTVPALGSCRLFLRFVRHVVCGGDRELCAYVIRWMAHLVQRPWELAEVALVLRSGQGTGKNTFVAPLAEIMGQMFFECTDIKRLAGNFNAHLKDKLLVHANEAIWGGNKSAEGTLKALITDPYRAVEPKTKDVITVRSYTRLIISSNEEWPVACGPDDRRFVFIDVSEARKQNHAYFKAIHEELNSGGVEALHRLLLEVDISDWHPRQRPKPKFGADVKIRSLDVVGQWWYDVLERTLIPLGEGSCSVSFCPFGTDEAVPKGTIVDAVEVFVRKQPRRERVPDRGALFKRLYELCPGVEETRPTGKSGARGRVYSCVFPPLDECRAAFEKAINCEGLIDWSQTADTDGG